mmetsp:Transcript_20520/g.30372  ORF Transcript_20520/g.30372 Transcript_20520/m.30372 type:complete len:318 (-) Transcript_20520:852-1805(-)
MLSKPKAFPQAGHFLCLFLSMPSKHSLQNMWKHLLITQSFCLEEQTEQFRILLSSLTSSTSASPSFPFSAEAAVTEEGAAFPFSTEGELFSLSNFSLSLSYFFIIEDACSLLNISLKAASFSLCSSWLHLARISSVFFFSAPCRAFVLASEAEIIFRASFSSLSDFNNFETVSFDASSWALYSAVSFLAFSVSVSLLAFNVSALKHLHSIALFCVLTSSYMHLFSASSAVRILIFFSYPVIRKLSFWDSSRASSRAFPVSSTSFITISTISLLFLSSCSFSSRAAFRPLSSLPSPQSSLFESLDNFFSNSDIVSLAL